MNPTATNALVWKKSSYSGAGPSCVEIAWKKSSYSGAGPDCVEVGWRKSSYSGADPSCVEVATMDETVSIRDSKDPHGRILTFPSTSFAQFLHSIRFHSVR
jgi:hypothetical protein